jgi:signal transduction histidine kinase
VTIGAAPVRRRRRLRLADVPVGAKLGVILVVPLLALVGLTAVGLSVYAAQVGRVGDLRAHIVAGADVGALIDGLQRERLAAARLLTQPAKPPGAPAGPTNQSAEPAAVISSRAAYLAQALRTDQAIHRYRGRYPAAAAGQPAPAGQVGPAGSRELRIRASLDALPTLRSRTVAGGPNEPASTLLFEYRRVIDDLVAERQIVAEEPALAEVTTDTRAVALLVAAKADVADAQVTVVRALGDGTVTPAEQQSLVAARGAYAENLRRFGETAPPDWRGRLDRALADPRIAAADGLAVAVTLAAPDEPLRADARAIDLGARSIDLGSVQLDALRSVEESADRATADAVTRARDAANRTIIVCIAVVLLVLAFSVALAALVARSMAQSLRLLKAGAWRVAYERLPHAVTTFQSPDAAASLSAQLISAAGDTVPVTGRDEIGQVAEAFNAVHREAVRAAAEQAALRTGVSTVLINLARRSLRLVDGLIEQLDVAERDETDPDRLALLFRFDHLVTRMRHANDSLLVLAGSDAARVRSDPVPLFDLLRAAQSQIEHYQRIEYGRIERDVAIGPDAVDAVVHALAELLDNATRFSPAEQPVFVDGRRTGDGATVQIADRGTGLPDDALELLNERLANPPALDVADSRTMGLAVVSRLAHRYGITVELRPAPAGGVVAVMRLPAELVCVTAPPDPLARPVPDPLERLVMDPPTAGTFPMLPRPLERAPALPGGEPLEIPVPRVELSTPRVAVAEGEVVEDAELVEDEEAGPLPRRTPKTPRSAARRSANAAAHDDPMSRDAAVVEPDEVRALLSSYQRAMDRFGRPPVRKGERPPEEGSPN